MLLITCPSLGLFLSLRLCLSILAGTRISWRKTLFQNLPLWHCPCYRLSKPNVRSFSPLRKKQETPQSSRRLSAGMTLRPSCRRRAAQGTHCPTKPYAAWLQKIPGVHIPQKLNKWQRHSKRVSRLVGVRILWHFSKKHTSQWARVKHCKHRATLK